MKRLMMRAVKLCDWNSSGGENTFYITVVANLSANQCGLVIGSVSESARPCKSVEDWLWRFCSTFCTLTHTNFACHQFDLPEIFG